MGFRWVTTIAIAAAGLSGALAGYLGRPVLESTSLSPEGAARRALSVGLVDPESMQLRGVRRTESGALCGEVNARNRMGGYQGFTSFVITDDGYVAIDPSGDGRTTLSDVEMFQTLQRSNCE